MMKRRLTVSIIAGALLGIVCVLGGSARAGGFAGNELYLAAMWYNRLVIGLVIGLASGLELIPGQTNRYLRGALLGTVVSAAFFLSSGLRDTTAFLAGIVYGVIIEWVAARFA